MIYGEGPERGFISAGLDSQNSIILEAGGTFPAVPHKMWIHRPLVLTCGGFLGFSRDFGHYKVTTNVYRVLFQLHNSFLSSFSK